MNIIKWNDFFAQAERFVGGTLMIQSDPLPGFPDPRYWEHILYQGIVVEMMKNVDGIPVFKLDKIEEFDKEKRVWVPNETQGPTVTIDLDKLSMELHEGVYNQEEGVFIFPVNCGNMLYTLYAPGIAVPLPPTEEELKAAALESSAFFDKLFGYR